MQFQLMASLCAKTPVMAGAFALALNPKLLQGCPLQRYSAVNYVVSAYDTGKKELAAHTVIRVVAC
jgi:hypothetical protein